jgi:uncharacterized protein with HEPN domain
MPSDRLRLRLQDIRDNIYLVSDWTAGFTFAQFVEDTMRVYAVTRALEIISEASRRLSDELKARHPQLPWSDIAGAGNIYRHNYDDVDTRELWRTATIEVPQLLAAVESELED